MDQSTEKFNQAKGKITDGIKTVMADGQDLLKAATSVSGARLAVAREKFGEKLCSAQASLMNASRPAVDKARRTASAANGYVHDNPWAFIGVAIAASALVAFLAAKRSSDTLGQSDS